MSNGLGTGFRQFYEENAASEVSIEYKKEAGADGQATLRANGLGAMLFDGVCTILKELALVEARSAGEPEAAEEYVYLVYKMVIEEVRGVG